MADDRETNIRVELLDCKHFTGIYRDECCGAGVNYRALVGGPDLGWAIRLPCTPLLMKHAKAEDVVTCDKRESWTREEAEQRIDKRAAAMERFFSAHKAAKADAKAKGYRTGHAGAGELSCPACEGGTLRYTVAACNGHMHGACSTKGCASWME